MREIEEIEFEEETPRDVASRASVQPSVNIDRRGLLIVCGLIVVAIVAVRGCPGPNPDPGPRPEPTPTPVIDEDGRMLLFLIDESDEDGITVEQAQAVHSTAIEEWADSNGFELRVFDDRDSLERTEPVWAKVKAVAAEPPSMTVVTDRKAKTGPVPEGVEETIRTLDGAVK